MESSLGIRRSYSQTVVTLCNDVLDEARTTTGTWSLAMHSRIRDTIPSLREDEIERFIREIVFRLMQPDISTSERFKLAQLCTMCDAKGIPGINAVLREHKQQMIDSAEMAGDDPLKGAVLKLLGSLCRDKSDSGSPRRILRPLPPPRAFVQRSRSHVSDV
jgi:hypothetical protein